MTGKPAKVRQRDMKQLLLAAQKAGAKEVRVDLENGTSVTIPLVSDDDVPVPNDNRPAMGSITDAVRKAVAD
jgi:hypothetical protein